MTKDFSSLYSKVETSKQATMRARHHQSSPKSCWWRNQISNTNSTLYMPVHVQALI